MDDISTATFRSDLRRLQDTCISCPGKSSPRLTEEWIAIYPHARAPYETAANEKLSA